MEEKVFSIAKINRPRLSGIVPRKRLFQSLDSGQGKPVTWISAPAGSGKTALVASYLDARKLPCIWYSMDPGDADAATFFYYMGLASRKAAPRFRKPLPLLTPEYLQGISVFTQRFFEKLYARLTSPFALVFDNYQEASEQAPVHDLVNLGLSLIPEGIQVFVLSRNEPPPAFMRLRANDAMRVVGWDELRFTLEESKQMVRLKAKQELTEDAIEELYLKTEGWAAGLVLLRESAGTKKPGPQSVGEPDKREVFDYFAGEVFSKLDSETRDFLLMSSFLPTMTAQAAEKMTDQDDAGLILAALNRNNFFTEKHATGEPSYQYHPLFREFLLTRMKESLTQAGVAHLQKKAAALLVASGQIEETVTLLVEAQDWNSLVPFILSRAASLISQGRSGTLEKWLADVPKELFENTPWLLYWSALCRFPFNYQESRTLCEKAFSLFRTGGDVTGALLAWAVVSDSISYEFGDLKRFDPWIKALQEILRARPDFPSPELEFRVVSSMAVALMFRKVPHAEVSPWIERAQDLTRNNANGNYIVQTSAYTSLYYVWLGELGEARRIIEDQERWARKPGASVMSRIVIKYSRALYQWIAAEGDFGMQAALDGLAESHDTGASLALHHLHARRIFAALNMNDLPTAKDAWDKMTSGASGKERIHMFQYHYVPAWMALIAGDFLEAGQQAKNSLRIFTDAGGSAFHLSFCHITAALALIGMNDYDGAAEHLSEGLGISLAMRSRILEFTCLLFNAYLRFEREKTNESDDGVKLLREALALGREQGYMNTVVWYPRAMPGLCAKALEKGIEVNYIRALIARRNIIPEHSVLHVEIWPWPLKVHTLGAFRIEKDGQLLNISSRAQKPLALLKALVALGGKGVKKDLLIDMLWPDAEGDAGQSAFTTTMARLRKMLGNEQAVLYQDAGATLNSRLCWCDVHAFERAYEKAESAWNNGNSRASAQELMQSAEKAMAIYKGHFLPDEPEHWAIAPRERLRNKYLRLIAWYGGHFEKECQWERAVEYYQKALETDSLVEDIYQRLMLCYHKLGRRADAIRTFERCALTLRTSLHVEPSEATISLKDKILKPR